MALIIEDGSQVAGANSYITLSGTDEYFDGYGDTRWSVGPTDAHKNAAILKGMRYLDGLDWKGTTVSGNSLQWPREDMVDRDGRDILTTEIPDVVVRAAYEAAVRSIGGPANLQPDRERGGKVASEQVGSISRVYKRSAPSETSYTVIMQLLKGLLKSTNTRDIVRA